MGFRLFSSVYDWVRLLACACAFAVALPGLSQDRSDSLAVAGLRGLDVPFFQGNEVHLLPSGKEFFDDLFLQLEQAERYIHIEFYKFYNDSIGNATLDLLRRKVRQGVEVKVLIDGFGNHRPTDSFTKEDLERLRAEGILMHEFSPFAFPYIHRAYHRDHRKIITIDGHTAYIGGMNIADYYLHGKPEVGDWLDMHIRMHGSCVAEYERLFAEMWHKVTGERMNAADYAGPDRSTDKILMGVVARKPGRESGLMRKAYAEAIDAARHNVRIVNAYPLLTRTVRRALYRALKRGVKVEIMLSANNDQQLTPDITAIQMKKLMDRGADIFYFEGGFHHAKVMMVDDTYCTVGSANLDARSLMFDYEINAFMFDKGVTDRLYDVYAFDKRSRCTLLTPENFKQRFTLRQRVRGRTLWFLKAVL